MEEYIYEEINEIEFYDGEEEPPAYYSLQEELEMLNCFYDGSDLEDEYL